MAADDDYAEKLREDIHREVRDRFQRKMERKMARFDEKMSRRREHHHSPAAGIVFGAIVVLVGLSLLLNNLGIVDFRDIWRYWPVLLIVYGVSRVFACKAVTSLIWGGAVALIGLLLLLDNLDIILFRFDYIWPLIVIAFGLSLLARAIDRKRFVAAASPPTSSDSVLNIVAVFGGSNRVVDNPDFRGGDIVSVFGGVRLDLRRAAITLDRVVLDVSAVFGGVEIRVPENWSVSTKGVGIFGGFDDKTLHPKPDANAKVPELVITGATVFGGMSVSN